MGFGARLKQLREEAHMDRERLGARLGMSYSTIAKYESDARFPDRESLLKLAEIFSVSVDYLLGRTNVRNEPTTLALHTEHDYEDLPEEAREDIRQFIEFVKQKYGKEPPEEE